MASGKLKKVGGNEVIEIPDEPVYVGYFSKVYFGRFDNKDVAVKRIDRLKLKTEEPQLLRRFDHDNIVRYLYMDEDSEYQYIVLEKCKCTLREFINDKEREIPLKSIDILKQISRGLAYLHKKCTIHRDLKPCNILLIFSGGKWRAKISDFGISKILDDDKTQVTQTQTSIKGSVGYRAPEILKKEKISKRADIFSLGITFFYVLSEGEHPYGSDNLKIDCDIRDGEEPNLNGLGDFDHDATTLILSTIAHKPDDRPVINEIQAHHIFWSDEKIVRYFQEVSDYCINPKNCETMKPILEAEKKEIVGNWRESISDPIVKKVLEDMKNKRQGDGVCDLLRNIRNLKNHYLEKPPEFREIVGETSDGLAKLFTQEFPKLLPYVYETMKCRKEDSWFKDYYYMKTNPPESFATKVDQPSSNTESIEELEDNEISLVVLGNCQGQTAEASSSQIVRPLGTIMQRPAPVVQPSSVPPMFVWYDFPPWPGPNPPFCSSPVSNYLPMCAGLMQHQQAQPYLERIRIQHLQNLQAQQQLQDQQIGNFLNQLQAREYETEYLTRELEALNSTARHLMQQFQSAPVQAEQLLAQLGSQQIQANQLAQLFPTWNFYTPLSDFSVFQQFVEWMKLEVNQASQLLSEISNSFVLSPYRIQYLLFHALRLLEQLQLRQLHIYKFQAEFFIYQLNNQIFETVKLPEQVDYPARQTAKESSSDLHQQQLEIKELLSQLIHEMDWHLALNGEFRKPYLAKVLEFVGSQRELYPKEVYPEFGEVYTWMRYCAVKPRTGPFNWIEGTTDVKVVILGQDPYPTSGHAHGLAFSCRETIPKSLQRIYEALDRDKDVSFTNPGHGDLTSWAKQGVLLLNTVLTVRTTGEIKNEGDCNCDLESESFFGNTPHFSGNVASTSGATSGYVALTSQKKEKAKKANSHSKCLIKAYKNAMIELGRVGWGTKDAMKEWGGVGWETFTDAVIKYISDNSEGVVFMLWGGFAHKKEKLIDNSRHFVLKTCHPAAYLEKHYSQFLKCKHFSRANDWLKSESSGFIKWDSLRDTEAEL